MTYTYNNILTENVRNSTFSIERDNYIGVSPSSNIIGGLQQVFSVSDFIFDYTDAEINQVVKKESNHIPVYYIQGGTIPGEQVCLPGEPPICFPGEDETVPSKIILNNDGFSSGRLKNGTIVYCYEKQQAYQFLIDNYNDLYTAAETESSYFTKTQYTTSVISGTTATDNFISAWVNHKVEGEPNQNGGVWTRGEANWKKYPNEEEYFAINNVPASELIDNFNFEDAIIVVPPSWHNKKVLSVTASIFTTGGSNVESTITLNQSAADGTKSEKSWTHSSNSKNSKSDFTPSLTLVEGATLQLSQSPKFGAGNFGYTATFKVKG